MNAATNERDVYRSVNQIRKGWSDAERQWRLIVGDLRRRALLASLVGADESAALEVATVKS